MDPGRLQVALKLVMKESSEIVPVVDRLLGEAPEPCSRGLLEVQLDELHGGITGAVIELYRRQVILDPGFRIL